MMCLTLSASLFTACSKKDAATDTQTTSAANVTVPAATEKTEPEILPDKKADELKKEKAGKADIDLCSENRDNDYNSFLKLLINPEDFDGKTVKLHGTFSINKNGGKNYYICSPSTKSGSASQGMEFTLSKDYKYPDDFPAPGEEITIFGKFEFYEEYHKSYCRIKDAVFTD